MINDIQGKWWTETKICKKRRNNEREISNWRQGKSKKTKINNNNKTTSSMKFDCFLRNVIVMYMGKRMFSYFNFFLFSYFVDMFVLMMTTYNCCYWCWSAGCAIDDFYNALGVKVVFLVSKQTQNPYKWFIERNWKIYEWKATQNDEKLLFVTCMKWKVERKPKTFAFP